MKPEMLWLLGRFSRPSGPRTESLRSTKFKDIFYQGLDEQLSFMSEAVGDYEAPKQPTVLIHPKEYVNGFLESSSVSVNHLALMAHVRYPDWRKALSLFPDRGTTRLQNMGPVLDMLRAGVKVEKECGVVALLTEGSPYILPTAENVEPGDPYGILDVIRDAPENLLLGPEEMADLDEFIEKLTADLGTQGPDLGANAPQELTDEPESLEAERKRTHPSPASLQSHENFSEAQSGVSTAERGIASSGYWSADTDTSADETDSGTMASALGFLRAQSHLLSAGATKATSFALRTKKEKRERPKIKYGCISNASVLEDIKELPTPTADKIHSPNVQLRVSDSHRQQTVYGPERLEAALDSEPSKKLKMQRPTQIETEDSMFADAEVPGPSRGHIARNIRRRALSTSVHKAAGECLGARNETKSAEMEGFTQLLFSEPETQEARKYLISNARTKRPAEPIPAKRKVGGAPAEQGPERASCGAFGRPNRAEQKTTLGREAAGPKVRIQHNEYCGETQIEETEEEQRPTDGSYISATCRSNKTAKRKHERPVVSWDLADAELENMENGQSLTGSPYGGSGWSGKKTEKRKNVRPAVSSDSDDDRLVRRHVAIEDFGGAQPMDYAYTLQRMNDEEYGQAANGIQAVDANGTQILEEYDVVPIPISDEESEALDEIDVERGTDKEDEQTVRAAQTIGLRPPTYATYRAVLLPAKTSALLAVSAGDRGVGYCYRLLGEEPVACLHGPGTSENIECAQLLLTLQHPNIIQPLAAYMCTNGTIVLGMMWHACPMHYVPKLKIKELTNRFPVFLSQLLDALCFLHEKNLVHNQINPQSVSVTDMSRESNVVLGSLRFHRTGDPINPTVDTPLNAFTAREVRLEGRKPTPASDVCAVGLLMKWLTKWKGNSSLPELFYEIVKQCTAHDPRERPTAREAFTDASYYHYRLPDNHTVRMVHDVEFCVKTYGNETLTKFSAINVMVPEETSYQRRAPLEPPTAFKTRHKTASLCYGAERFAPLAFPLDPLNRRAKRYEMQDPNPFTLAGTVVVYNNAANRVKNDFLYCIHPTTESPNVFLLDESPFRVVKGTVALCYDKEKNISWNITCKRHWAYPLMACGLSPFVRAIYSLHVFQDVCGGYYSLVTTQDPGVLLTQEMASEADLETKRRWLREVAAALWKAEEGLTHKHESDIYGYDLNCVYLKKESILLNPFACTKTKWKKSNCEFMIDFILMLIQSTNTRDNMTAEEELEINTLCGTRQWTKVLPNNSVELFDAKMAIPGMGEIKVPAFANNALGGTCFYFRNSSDTGLSLEVPMTTAQYKI